MLRCVGVVAFVAAGRAVNATFNEPVPPVTAWSVDGEMAYP